jgi:hypothetical protein
VLVPRLLRGSDRGRHSLIHAVVGGGRGGRGRGDRGSSEGPLEDCLLLLRLRRRCWCWLRLLHNIGGTSCGLSLEEEDQARHSRHPALVAVKLERLLHRNAQREMKRGKIRDNALNRNLPENERLCVCVREREREREREMNGSRDWERHLDSLALCCLCSCIVEIREALTEGTNMPPQLLA